jgi:hypothetical protein
VRAQLYNFAKRGGAYQNRCDQVTRLCNNNEQAQDYTKILINKAQS